MIVEKKNLKTGMRRKIFGCFFAIVMIFLSLFGAFPGTSADVYAEPEEGTSKSSGASCQDSLGSLGWLVCPTTGKISEAVDFLYDKIEDVLVINPVEAKDGSPVYEIWKYFQGVTNVVFMIFLLVIVFSQITGWGINNYGVKKALPKLIIAAILVNLSFYICSLAVDASNIFGGSIRGLLESIEASAGVGAEVGEVSGASMAEMYTALASGATLTIGGAVVAFETGAIWMMIPMALGALVSVVIGLVTIAMRQAVVTLLIMVAPLAMVAYILPNTEQWFKKWKQLLFQMLIFYPAFSLLFGASSIAGWAIIVSSNNGFGVLIGTAVQIFPLFFSWNLMKMSGTVLGTINAKLSSLASKPLKGVRSAAEAQRELSKQKHLASKNAYTPSLKLMQFMSDRKIAMEAETKEHEETVKNRGLAYAAMRNYKRGTEIPSKEGEEASEAQARNMRYKWIVERHKDNMEKGLGQLEAVKQGATKEQKARLNALDEKNVKASDALKMEKARGEVIAYKNAKGFHRRMEDAMNAHMDAGHAGKNNATYKPHFDPGSVAEAQARARYDVLSKIMEGNVYDAQYAAATAAHGYDTQNKVYTNTMQKYFELLPPTKDLTYRMNELTIRSDAADNMDAIIAGMRVLSDRGDTDLVREQVQNVLRNSGMDKLRTEEDIRKAIESNYEGIGIQYGTHASQALSSFLMFDVGDKDPTLKRFGKFINLETAHVYNKNVRKNMRLTLEEYLKGEYEEYNSDTGEIEIKTPSKDAVQLLEGTSFDKVERTTYRNLDEMLMDAYKDKDGKLDVKSYLGRRKQIETSIAPQFISASLKYLSGSEQLRSAVDFLTGYNKGKQRWFWDPNDPNVRGELALSADDAEYARKYFETGVMTYLNGQTPSQILSLRSDYKEPLLEHLSNAYKETDMDGWNEEAKKEHEEYVKELADIQTRYGDLPVDEAKRKRDMDIKQLRNKMAGAQFRQLLDSKGKLNQIYRTRRSGAANNAKDWVREWLGLDNDAEIEMKLNAERQRTKKALEEAKKNDPNYDADSIDPEQINSEKNIKMRLDFLSDKYDSYKGESPEAFYNEIREFLINEVGRHGYILKEFERYYDAEKEHGIDVHEMTEWLRFMIGDPNNY